MVELLRKLYYGFNDKGNDSLYNINKGSVSLMKSQTYARQQNMLVLRKFQTRLPVTGLRYKEPYWIVIIKSSAAG